ncbi:MAG: type I restriction endonuclease subunit R [Pedobacter sp.]|nr:MAG: type I restriction endonuclease subunit R [Pedobacter sp.]
MSTIHKEITFEQAIEESLIGLGGYSKGSAAQYNRQHAMDIPTVVNFIQQSQPKEWEKLQKLHGADIETKFIKRLFQELDLRGTLDVLRNGITDLGVRFRLSYFRPESGLNPDTERLYQLNILTVTRQVHYSVSNENSIDILLSINGLPIATLELKNPFTKQDITHAKRQYIQDRDARELLFQFKKRALVHFAVDPDEVYLTTKLDGNRTKFLPFNLGNQGGAGNPMPLESYKTSYLWEYVLTKDSWMDIVGKFLHVQSTDYVINGKKSTKETIIFPRYHQLDAVRQLSADAKKVGAGKNYLIQHSAGSGKSNTIAWLSYRLSSLHNAEDKRVFNSVIVITDRKVLDQQLQNTIYQFEHKQGVVQKIDKDSSQLAKSLETGANIIITTLQKFPFILDKVGVIPSRKYAVIIDEAHSSQGGESAKKMKEVLAAKTLEEAERDEADSVADEDTEDYIRKSMQARGKQDNISFFAFTATPKPKTLEVFGEVGSNGEPQPSHLYSMRQAIEEGFIHDVLKNYTTYKTYFQLSKAIEDDPELNKKKAARAIGKFLSLHPYNIAQKTQIIIEHFRQVVSKKIGGKAKAMVVTGSRLHAVKYKLEFDRYIREKGYTEIKALVAFSGKVLDELGLEYTEAEMNGFGEKALPEKFNTDEYQLLLVADKYQTGFDQPLLHTMYVDKLLSGVKAVQTLSRLNRTVAGKEDTFVLDFANEREDILKSFQPYYECTTLSETTDPNHLYNLKANLEAKQVYWQSEIDAFSRVFFKPTNLLSAGDQAKLYGFIEPSVDRYKHLESDEEREDFKHTLTVFTRLYSFLSQIMPFQDAELEKLFAFGRLLLNKLPKGINERFKLDDEVALQYYRLEKIHDGAIPLEEQGKYTLKPTTEAGLRGGGDEYDRLSNIISVLNDKLGTDFTDADQLFFDQIEEEIVQDATLSKQAQSNPMENFRFAFDEAFNNKVIDRMEQNHEIFTRIMDDATFAALVRDYMLNKVFKRLNLRNLGGLQ